MGNPLTVDEGAVCAAGVLDGETVSPPNDTYMTSGDFGVDQDQVIARAAADCHLLGLQRDLGRWHRPTLHNENRFGFIHGLLIYL